MSLFGKRDSAFLRACRENARSLADLGFAEHDYRRSDWGEAYVISSPRAFLRIQMEWPRDAYMMTTLGPLFEGRVPPYPVFGTEPLLHVTVSDLMALRGDPDPARVQRLESRREIPERVAENIRAVETYGQPELAGDFASFADVENAYRRKRAGRSDTPRNDIVKVRVFAPQDQRWEVLDLLATLAFVRLSEESEGVFDARFARWAIHIEPQSDADDGGRERVSVRFGVVRPAMSGFMVLPGESDASVNASLEQARARLGRPVVAVWPVARKV